MKRQLFFIAITMYLAGHGLKEINEMLTSRYLTIVMMTLLWVRSSLLMAIPQQLMAASRSEVYQTWLPLSTPQLLERGRNYLNSDCPDSALICYQLIIDRADDGQRSNTWQQTAQAYIGKWQVCYYHFFDYSTAFDCLNKAQQYAANDLKLSTTINMEMGNFYQGISDQCQDTTYVSKAMNCYRRALSSSLQTGNSETLGVIMSNLVNMSFVHQFMAEIEGDWQRYIEAGRLAPDSIFTYNRLMYDGFRAALEGEYGQASQCFDQQIQLFADAPQRLRYQTMGHINKAKVLAMANRYDEAVQCLRPAEEIGSRYQVKDIMLEVYNTLSDYLTKAGHPAEAQAYHIRYLELKDEVLTLQQLTNLSEQSIISELAEAAAEVRTANQKRERMRLLAYAASAIALAILILLFVIYRKNRQLHERNRSLYDRMQALLAQQLPSTTEDKYSSSNLEEQQKQELQTRIRAVMQSDAIYSSEFTGTRLSELLDVNYKYVSQVINESFGCNFNTLLNTYRIQEVCRRISDREHYGHLTIEGIAHSVGFKARSSFSAAFKANTGLTPSEYQKIAHEKG